MKFFWSIIEVIGWALCLCFIVLFISAYVDCPISSCNDSTGVAYYPAFMAFLTILPVGLLLVIIARFIKWSTSFTEKKEEHGRAG